MHFQWKIEEGATKLKIHTIQQLPLCWVGHIESMNDCKHVRDIRKRWENKNLRIN